MVPATCWCSRPTSATEGRRVAVRRAVAAYGRIDGVVHSAAVVAYGKFTEIPAEVFDHSLQTNVTGAANVAQERAPPLRRGPGGSLVVVGSVLGKIATPYMSPYTTSKWAIHGLVRTLQIEARETPGVHVSLISPGGVNTPVYDQAGSYTGHPGHPPPPVASPERVARDVVQALDEPQRDRDVGLANGPWWLGSGCCRPSSTPPSDR